MEKRKKTWTDRKQLNYVMSENTRKRHQGVGWMLGTGSTRSDPWASVGKGGEDMCKNCFRLIDILSRKRIPDRVLGTLRARES